MGGNRYKEERYIKSGVRYNLKAWILGVGGSPPSQHPLLISAYTRMQSFCTALSEVFVYFPRLGLGLSGDG